LDKFMIATSEQPITALYRNKVIEKAQLPLRFVGISSCFRKEAGSSGRDIRGIFRVHQFEKVEQFVICDEENSREEHDRLKNIAEKFYQSLGLAYHIVNIVSGEINDAASKK
jgi:seryl-tRNA synthetase